MAAICQTFPGTYFPRFETNQMRAAAENGSDSDHTRSVARQASMRRRYVAITSAPEASTRGQSNRNPSSAGATPCHWRASSRAANPTTIAAMIHCAMSTSLPLRRANDRAINTGVAAGGRFGGKSRKRHHPPGSAKLGASLGMVKQLIQGSRQGVDVPRRNEQARALMLHRVRQAARLVRDDWRLTELGLDRDEAEALVGRRDDHCSGPSIQVDKLRLRERTEPTHTICQP